METFSCGTDTAAFAVFDLAAMKHRKNDSADWWSLPIELIAEMNRGNLLVFAVGADGLYDLTVKTEERVKKPCGILRVVGGKLYFGPGEDITGGDLEPDEGLEGVFLEVAPGTYGVEATRVKNHITLSLAAQPSSERLEDSLNRFTGDIEL